MKKKTARGRGRRTKRLPKKGTQLTLARTGGIGGKRKGAGRKVAPGTRRCVPHRKRPALDGKKHPVHVTIRVKHAVGVPSLRCEVVNAVFAAVRRRVNGTRFHVVHHSLQHDHVHLIVEAEDARALSHGMSSLVIRFAKTLNAAIGRKGAVWDGRYHRHDLETPTETANAIVYVLQNGKKHGLAAAGSSWLDTYSSAREFDGWRDAPRETGTAGARAGPAGAAARTWLLRTGYTRARLTICSTSAPRTPPARGGGHDEPRVP